MVRKLARDQRVKPNEVSFIQRQVRELTNLCAGTVKMYIRILTGYEYLQVLSGKRHGTRYSYRIREDSPLEAIDLSMIPSPDSLKRGAPE